MSKKQKGAKPSAPSALTLEQIKRLVIIAIFSDDGLMERFVLKGGNALDIVHEVSARASFDVDLSMEDGFREDEVEEVQGRILSALQLTFRAEGYEAFDLHMKPQPPQGVTPDLAHFWGGYKVEFKLIERAKFDADARDLEALRRRALKMGAQGKFSIDVSSFEYVEKKQPKFLDDYRIFVYTPEMLVAEKLRAICQQMPEYGPVVRRGRPGSARAKDYVDIHTLIERLHLDMTLPANLDLLMRVFEAKRVPLDLLVKIPSYRRLHEPDFQQVRATVKPDFDLKSFDDYAEFVEGLARDVAQRTGAGQSPLGT